jgi:hypothetical protein
MAVLEGWGFLVFAGFAIIALGYGFYWIYANPADNTVTCKWDEDRRIIRDRLFVELVLLIMGAFLIIFITAAVGI